MFLLKIFKCFIFIYTLSFLNISYALDVTVYLDNWSSNITETYNVHSDKYIYLDEDSNDKYNQYQCDNT